MKNPLNIVIICGTIYPLISPRSTRATELAIELARKGHNVTIYSLLGRYDYSQFSNKYNIVIKNLGISYFGNINSDGKKNDNILNKFATRLFFKLIDFPRIEYLFMVIKVLKHMRKFDYLITIAHPFPIHWGVCLFKSFYRKSIFKFWVSDCGDPFMGDPDIRRPFYLKYIEKCWCKSTDLITVPIENAVRGYFPEYRDKIRIIPQGVRIDNIEIVEYQRNSIPTFAYCGATYNGFRDPKRFLLYLSTLDIDFRFVVYTPDNSVFHLFKKLLGNKLDIRTYIPREKLIPVLSSMDFLINIKNESQVQQPSKLIDYSLAKRPVIEITTSFHEKATFEQFLRGDYSNQMVLPDISKYNISNIADKFIELYYENKNK